MSYMLHVLSKIIDGNNYTYMMPIGTAAVVPSLIDCFDWVWPQTKKDSLKIYLGIWGARPIRTIS